MERPAIGNTRLAGGWHEDLPMAEYLADPAVSASLLWTLHTSTPGHLLEELRAKANGTGDSTKAKELGTVIHVRVYEPTEFDDRYVVIGQCEKIKNDGERCSNQGSVIRDGQSFCGVKGHDPAKGEPMAPGLETVPAELRRTAIEADKALRAHFTAREILEAEGPREVTGVWQDPATGLWLRIRPDQLILEPTATPARWHWSVANLKSTGKVAKGEPFRRDFENAGNHFKAAFYRMVIRELWPVEPQNFFYPVVETYPPYAVIVHRLDDEWMDAAEGDVRETLRQLAECIELDYWPTYGSDVHDLTLPDWRMRQIRSLELVGEEVTA